jgi:hypothetical protein
MVFNISNTAGNLTEFQVYFDDIDTESLINQGRMQEDCGDIRFGNTSGHEIPYFVEPRWCNNNETRIWIQVPFLQNYTNTTVYMYYGSLGTEVTTGNEEEVFNYSSNTSVLYPVGYHNANRASGVISFRDSNMVATESIAGGLWSQEMSEQETASISGSYHDQNSSINATRPVYVDCQGSGSNPGDAFVPLGWATRTVGYSFYRYNNRYYIYSPFGDADIQINIGNDNDDFDYNNETFTVEEGQVEYTTIDPPDEKVMWMNSSIPVLVFVESDDDGNFPSEQDNFPAHAPNKDLYGMPSTNLDVGAMYDDTIVRVYFTDDLTSQTLFLDEGQVLELTRDFIPNDDGAAYNCGGGSGTDPNGHGDCGGAHIVSNYPVSAIQTADCDGVDVTTFLPEYTLSREYYIPNTGEYITIVTIVPNTKCELYAQGSTTPYWSDISDANTYPHPDRLYYGYDESSMISAGSKLVCNSTVFAYY